MKRLNIAMLSDDNQIAEEQVMQVEQDHLYVLGQQVEDDLLQAQEIQIQSDKEDLAVEDAIQATQDLMEEQEVVQSLTDRKEEVSQVAMESIRRNVKNILKTIGMEDSTGGENGFKLNASSIAEFIKKIWQKIKEVWFRIVDAIKSFFQKLFSASVGLNKRAIAIKEEAKKRKGMTLPADVVFNAPESVQANMRMDYKAIPAATIDRGLAKQNETMVRFISNLTSNQALSRYEAVIGDLSNKIADNAFKKKEYDFFEDTADKKEQARLTNMALEPVLVYFTQKKHNLLATPAFISDTVITLDVNTQQVGISKIDGEKDLKGQHEALELFQIEKVCDIVSKQMEQYKALNNIADDFKKFSKQIENIQSDLMNQKKDTPFIVRKAQARVAAVIVRFFMNIVKTVATQARVIDMQVNKAAIDWCAASLRLYK